jgi:two-component system, LytTR family, response regulator LytT
MKLTAIILSKNAVLTRALINLSSKSSEVQILRTVSSSEECSAAIHEDLPDVVFVDVDFFVGVSFDAYDKMAYLPQIVCIVSPDHQAQDFLQHLSLLLKEETYAELTYPITSVKFRQVMDTLHYKQLPNTASFLQGEQKSLEQKKEVFVRNEQGYMRVLLDDIFYFENVGEYVSIKTSKGNFIILATMKSLERRLNTSIFIKTHRSYIVNMKHINCINDTHLTVMSKTIPISRAHRQYLLNAINIL